MIGRVLTRARANQNVGLSITMLDHMIDFDEICFPFEAIDRSLSIKAAAK